MKWIARGCFVGLCALAALLSLPASPAAAQTEPPLCSNVPKYHVQTQVSPTFREDRTLFILVRNADEARSEVWRSQDGGLTWNMVYFDPQPILELEMSPQFVDDQTLMLVTYTELAVSHDAGQTWDVRPLPALHYNPTLFVTGPTSLYLSLQSHRGGPPYDRVGTYYSADEGNTWGFWTNRVLVAVSPFFEQDSTMLAWADGLCGASLCLSTDRGQTWSAPQSDPGSVQKVLFSPTYDQDHTIYANADRKLYRSVDGGVTWQYISIREWDESWRPLQDFVLSPRYAEDHSLWIHGGLYGSAVSRDGGASWSPPSLYMIPVAAMDDCSSATGCRVAVIGRYYYNGGLYKSYDYGQTWQCLETPYAPPALPPAEIPEPGTLLLLASGLAALAGYVRIGRRQRIAERMNELPSPCTIRSFVPPIR